MQLKLEVGTHANDVIILGDVKLEQSDSNTESCGCDRSGRLPHLNLCSATFFCHDLEKTNARRGTYSLRAYPLWQGGRGLR